MKKYYIIYYNTKIEGMFFPTYHYGLRMNKSRWTMNKYVELVTKDKKKATKFYDKDEAERVGKFFEKKDTHTPIIIQV